MFCLFYPLSYYIFDLDTVFNISRYKKMYEKKIGLSQ